MSSETASVLTVRNETECGAAALTAEDQLIQSMPGGSPTKRRRAHASWFFDGFLVFGQNQIRPAYDPAWCFPAGGLADYAA